MSDSTVGIHSLFRTVQGEGVLSGVPMFFIRTAGCSVGCPGCDTNYSFQKKMSLDDIVAEVQKSQHGGWVWITGGEPLDHGSVPYLIFKLKHRGYRVALATSGLREFLYSEDHGFYPDFMSVSPHTVPCKIMNGDQVNIVPGLNGISLDAFMRFSSDGYSGFSHRFVTPLYGSAESVAECVEFVNCNPGWNLGWQAHKQWGIE